MQILGSSAPFYLQSAISSGMDSVSEGLVHQTSQQSIGALDNAISTFSLVEPNAQVLFETQTPISPVADYPDPISFLNSQGSSSELLGTLNDPMFRPANELSAFSAELSRITPSFQASPKSEFGLQPEQTLKNLESTVLQMTDLQRSFDSQFQQAQLLPFQSSKASRGSFPQTALQNSMVELLQKNLQKQVPAQINPAQSQTAMSLEKSSIPPGQPFQQLSGSLENLPLEKANRMFIRDGSDIDEVDMNDVGASGNPFMMTWVAALARQNPQKIKDMIRENADGTYTVTFQQRISNDPVLFKERPVTVSADFARSPQYLGKEIWPRLIEDAMVQAATEDSKAGKPSLSIPEAFTGSSPKVRDIWDQIKHPDDPMPSFEQMKSDFDAGKIMVFSKEGRQDLYFPGAQAAARNFFVDDRGVKWIEVYDPNKPESPIRKIPYDHLYQEFDTLSTSQLTDNKMQTPLQMDALQSQQSMLQQKTSIPLNQSFQPVGESMENLPLENKANRLFFKDGTDVEEIDMNDVEEWKTGDYRLKSWISAVARQDPQRIKDMIRDNGDNTYTVFFKETIPNTSPPEFRDRPVLVKADFVQNPMKFGKEIWPRLIEAGYVNLVTATPAHIRHLRGLPEALTGRPISAEYYLDERFPESNPKSFEQMKSDFESGKLILLSRNPSGPGAINLDQDQAVYATVKNVFTDEYGTQLVEVYNPGESERSVRPYQGDFKAPPEDRIVIQYSDLAFYFNNIKMA